MNSSGGTPCRSPTVIHRVTPCDWQDWQPPAFPRLPKTSNIFPSFQVQIMYMLPQPVGRRVVVAGKTAGRGSFSDISSSLAGKGGFSGHGLAPEFPSTYDAIGSIQALPAAGDTP